VANIDTRPLKDLGSLVVNASSDTRTGTVPSIPSASPKAVITATSYHRCPQRALPGQRDFTRVTGIKVSQDYGSIDLTVDGSIKTGNAVRGGCEDGQILIEQTTRAETGKESTRSRNTVSLVLGRDIERAVFNIGKPTVKDDKPVTGM
jgi:hypothetical protein